MGIARQALESRAPCARTPGDSGARLAGPGLLTRSERLRDWNGLVEVVEQRCVAGAHHLDIVRHPGFMAELAQALKALESGRRPEVAKFAEATSVF